MAVTTGTITSTSGQGVLTLTFAATIIAANTRLAVFTGNDGGTARVPTGITCAGSAMAVAASHEAAALGMGNSWWYINNPTVGSPSIIVTLPNTSTACGVIAIPLSGSDLSQVPVGGTPVDVNPNTIITCAVTGAGINDLQLGGIIARSSTLTSAGAPQVNLRAISAINGLDSVSADSIPGSSSGNFSWTLASSNYGTALGILVKALAAGSGPSGVWGGSEGLIGGASSQGFVGGASAQGLWDGVEGLR